MNDLDAIELKGRPDGRSPEQHRPFSITPAVSPYAEGSAEVRAGNTVVLVTCSIEQEVPPWMKPGSGGWMTAEYGMLPRSTHTRNKREAASGKQSGRTLEIQRLIGRALRAAVSLQSLPPVTLRFDCDVLCADGGTRTAAISGAWVALAQAGDWMHRQGIVSTPIPLTQVAALSAGFVQGRPCVDLAYDEDSRADFDLNLVVDDEQRIIEIQGTAERAPYPFAQIQALIELTIPAIRSIMTVQRDAVEAVRAQASR